VAKSPPDPALETLRALSDAASDAVAIHDGTRIVAVNAAFCRLHGYREDEILGRGFLDFVAPEWREDAARRMRAGESGPYESMGLHRDGSILPVEHVARVLTFRGRPAHAVSIRDIRQHKQAEAVLIHNQKQLSAIFSQATVGLSQSDLSGRFVLVNDCYCELVGRSREDLLALRMQDILNPTDLPAFLPLLERAIEAGEPFTIENELARPDGRTLWVSNSVTAIRDLAGRPTGLLEIMVDISERRAAEERQRLLMREVDHRAKNALAVVQALVRLTRAGTQAAFVQAVEGRVGALARTHTLLAQNRWSSVDLRTLLEGELAAYQGQSPSRLQLEGPPISLLADAVQPLGMIVHELATNAAKHGALSRPTGRLELSWRMEPDEGTLHLHWLETGGPAVVAPSGQGFGSTLIERTARHQLSGEVRYDWRPEGLRCTICIPASHLLLTRPAVRQALPIKRLRLGGGLAGMRVLVAEDDALLAMTVELTLASEGCAVVGPTSILTDTIRLAAGEAIDMAILDVNLRGRSIFPVIEVLEERGIPYLFTTGYENLDHAPAGAPILRKPFTREELIRALLGLLPPFSKK
jgi:PAS domain S-box-containing protein